LYVCRKNGDPFVNLLSITPIHDARGKLTHYVGIQSDITELVNHKKAELAARHAALQVCRNMMLYVVIQSSTYVRYSLTWLLNDVHCFEEWLSSAA
jgi:hypothetical protein